jgi:hypothetical protein
MRPFLGLLLATLLVTSVSSLRAQQPADPSGHWEGMVQTPNTALKVEIDLARKPDGGFLGTLGQPEQGVKGLPLSSVAVENRSIRLVVKGGPEPATFDGLLAADGTSIAGTVFQGGLTMPLNLTRTGEASIAPPPKSAAIGKEFEGTWNGTLDVNGQQMRLIVKMANQSDGAAVGTVVSPDGSGVEIPIAMTQKATSLTIDVTSVGAKYVGALSPSASELVGTWTQGPASLPLTLRLAKP